MTEVITNFVSNYKGKIKNPLIGTIIGVWIIRNWRIVYSVLIFDDECTMQDKINYINDYFSKKAFWGEIASVVGIAFASIIITFILLAVSRALTDSYYKIAEPFIINLLDRNTIFTNVEREKLLSKIERLNSNLVTSRDANSKLENQNLNLIARTEQNEKKYDEKLLEFSEFQRSAFKNYELLENKNIPANKVINYFDDVLAGFSDSLKKELSTYIEHSDNITSNQYKNFVGIIAELQKTGVLINENGTLKKSILGLLFLEYYKSLKEQDLPF